MKTFTVKWEIQVEGENPTDACKNALEIMQDKNSEALAFEVDCLEGDGGEDVFVDLLPMVIERDEKIYNIKRIIREFGSFTVADVEANSSPVINSLGKDTHQLAENFLDDKVDAVTYVHETETNSEYISYGELSDDVIDEIEMLAQDWEADQLQTEKRISD